MQRRSLNELINKDEPRWPTIQGWLQAAKNQVESLPPSDPGRGDALVGTQVTTRSPMGAVVYESGGLLVDYGWLRILGSGHPRLSRSLPEWNNSVGNGFFDKSPPFLLIADDAVGGFFAVDGGALGKPGSVFYHAPDTLTWEDLGSGYEDFLFWCLNGDLQQFYSNCRWPDWQAEVAELGGDQGISVYPFLFADGPPIGSRQRAVVPIHELYGLYINDLPNQLLQS